MVNANNKNVPWNANPAAGTRKILLIHNVEFPFRSCPAGTFWMGSPEDEKGRCLDEILRKVTLPFDFWLMETSVTQAMWSKFEYSNPSYFSSTGGGKGACQGFRHVRFSRGKRELGALSKVH